MHEQESRDEQEQAELFAIWAQDAEAWQKAQIAWEQYLDELTTKAQEKQERKTYRLMGNPMIVIGLIVHYVAPEQTDPEQHNAAIVSHIWHDDIVRLHVLTEDTVQVVQQVGMSSNEHIGNTWHYCHDCDA